MTERERSAAQQETAGSLPHEQTAQLSPRQLPGEAGGIRTLAQSAGNNAIGEVLTGGSPLDAGFREQMERRLGISLSDVRVHDDGAAHRNAASLDADAFTIGDQITLGRNAPSAREAAGQELLAHELIHVIQQREAAQVRPEISMPGDQLERNADQESARALTGESARIAGGASVPAIQRQPAASITKRVERTGASRAEVEQAILAFLQKAQAAGGGTFHSSEAVKIALRMLAESGAATHGPKEDSERIQRSVQMEALLKSFSGDAAELAHKAAEILPEPFDRATLDKLQTMPVADQKSMPERVKDLAEKSFPKQPHPPEGLPPSPDKRMQEEMEKLRAASGQPQPHGLGPFSLDIPGTIRFLRKLPQTIKPKTPGPQTQPRSYPEVDQAISKIAEDALVPAAARGTDQADNYAEAREVAADLARKLDVAQQQQRESVDLRLPDSYNQAKDRAAMIAAVMEIVQAIRQALPHHASAVKYVDIYFGDRLVSRSSGSPSQ